MGRRKLGLEILEIAYTVTGWQLNIASSVLHGIAQRVVSRRIGPVTGQFAAFQNCK
jgi:hypothetical protein